MTEFPFYLNCMDPGGTTGLGLLRIEEEDFTVEETGSVIYDPETGSSPIDTLKKWRKAYADAPHIMVYEEFHIRPGRKNVDTDPLKVIAEFTMWMNNSGDMKDETAARVIAWAKCKLGAASPDQLVILKELSDFLEGFGRASGPAYQSVIRQEPVHAKNIATDPVLDRLGLKLLGHERRHINDAFRHAVALLAQWRYMPVCSRAWPRAKPLPHSGFTSLV